MNYGRILLAVDGSPCSMLALEHAAALARCGGGMVVVLHVFPEVPELIGGEGRKEVMAEERAKADAIIGPCLAFLADRGVAATGRVEEGDAAPNIADVAVEEQCDIIIMGSRGMGELMSAVLGSVSHDVLELSQLPVLIAR